MIFLVLGLLNSKLLGPLNSIWVKLGELLGRIIAPIVMAIIYFTILTPIGLLMRIIGKDLLNIKFSKNKSYWTKREKCWLNEKAVLIMMSFIKEFLGILGRKEKILVITNYNCACAFWCVNCVEPRVCCSTIYLYNFLSDINFRNFSFYHDSRSSDY